VDLALYPLIGMGLRSSVQVRNGNEVIHKSSDGTINQLERTVVKKISREDQVVDLGVRSVFNSERASILIKNMPVDDQAKYQQIKNSIALLTNATEIRLLSLVQPQSMPHVSSSASAQDNHHDLEVITQHTVDLLDELEKSMANMSPQYIKIMSDLGYKLEGCFSELALTESQEQMLMDLVDQSINDAHNIQVTNEEISKQLTDLVSEMRHLAKAG